MDRYVRYFLGSDGQKIGGLFTATGKLLKDLYNADDENYDDINYSLSMLENEIVVPDLDYFNNNYNFAFNKSFTESKKIRDLIEDLDYYLRLCGYEIISEEFNVPDSDIVYKDATQISYKLHEVTQNAIDKSQNDFIIKFTPKYLYHATYKPFYKSIITKGLGNTNRKMWSDSKGKGTVYLSTSPEVAYSYAETSEWLDDVEDYDKYADNIIVLVIDTNKLDKNKLFVDENVLLDNDVDPTFEYHGIIDSTAIVKIVDEQGKSINEDINLNSESVMNTDKYLTEKLEIHDTLNPKIWNNDKTLRSDVKIALYDIIDEFVNNSNFLTKDDIITANIVGSNASYNYTDFSDLDLHLVVDFDELSSDGKFVGYASDSERVIFNRRYDIDINGVNAEIYVEDIKSLPVSNGIYDLYKETWIKQPVKLKAPEIDNNLYNNIYNKTKSEALKLLDTASSAKSIKNFINKLYIDRRNSLAKDGEAGIYNQVFKDIRNEGILDNLKDLYYELRSEELSIDNDDTQLENILRQTAFGYNY